MNKTIKYRKRKIKSKKRKIKIKSRKYRKTNKKAGSKDYYDPKLWGHQNVAKHRDQYVEYPEKKAIFKQLPDDLIRKIVGSTPPKSLHLFLKEDIGRVANKFDRHRREDIKSHEHFKYIKPTKKTLKKVH